MSVSRSSRLIKSAFLCWFGFMMLAFGGSEYSLYSHLFGKGATSSSETLKSSSSETLRTSRALGAVGDSLPTGSLSRALQDDEGEAICIENFPVFCGGALLVDERCVEAPELEGACCIIDNEIVVEESKRCISKLEDECAFGDLCVAELIPGSNVGAECFKEFEKKGGILLYLFMLIYLFVALAIVCDDYFTFALDRLGDALGMSSDVKGATFAAIGSSAPELFVSLADNVISNPPKSVGVGTIVGSAIFNILIIIGASAIVAGGADGKKQMKLDWRPLARDSLFYIISIVALVGTAVTGDEALFYEGLVLLLIYFLYLLFMKYNQRIFDFVDRSLGIKKEVKGKHDSLVPAEKEVDTLTNLEQKIDGEEEKAPTRRRSSINIGGADFEPKSEEEVENLPYFQNLYWPMYIPVDSEGTKMPVGFCNAALGGGFKMWMRRVYFLIVFPINVFFRFTIPDSKYDIFREDKVLANVKVVDRRMKAYWIEFIMCIVWIALLSQLLVFSAAKFGCLVGIAPSVMGLTVLAAGTSVPDALTSVIMTRRGEGDAAVANSIGSNVFDILVGLGLPWFLAGVIFGRAEIATGDIGISIGFLFGVLIILLGSLALTKFHLTRNFGIFLIILYIFYVLFELFIRPRFFAAE